jgi:hypothetical protein
MDSLVDLINAAQALLSTGFDVQQFFTWKSLAFLSLLGLLGPLHYYTKTFCRVTEAPDLIHLMAGEDVLMAIKEGLPQTSEQLSTERDPEFQDGKSTSYARKKVHREVVLALSRAGSLQGE